MSDFIPSKDHDRLTEAIIGGAIEVHKALGPGLLESTYEECLTAELQHRGLHIARQLPLAIHYRNVVIPQAYFMDMVVEQQVILEIKAVEKLIPIHQAQILTYMKLSNLKKGLLLNFNVPLLRDGIKRLII